MHSPTNANTSVPACLSLSFFCCATQGRKNLLDLPEIFTGLFQNNFGPLPTSASVVKHCFVISPWKMLHTSCKQSMWFHKVLQTVCHSTPGLHQFRIQQHKRSNQSSFGVLYYVLTVWVKYQHRTLTFVLCTPHKSLPLHLADVHATINLSYLIACYKNRVRNCLWKLFDKGQVLSQTDD